MLYRLFPWHPDARPADDGGPLFVPRHLQGRGRHDLPSAAGILYTSRRKESVVAEFLSALRRHAIDEADLSSEGRPYAIAPLDDAGLAHLVDLDDPRVLEERSLRPSGVATGDRRATRPIAHRIFREGHAGFEWWSTIEASWINVTLFAERAVPKLALAGRPEPLTLEHSALIRAAEVVGVRLGSASTPRGAAGSPSRA